MKTTIQLVIRSGSFEMELSPSMMEVIRERNRQITQENWSPEHDALYNEKCELIDAASCYLRSAYTVALGYELKFKFEPPSPWPWARNWWKPTTPRRDLVKAAALILAEIDRLDRLEAPTVAPDPLPGGLGV